MKKCARCKIEKEKTEFFKSDQTKDRCSSYCKTCKAEIDREYYLLNRDNILQRVKERSSTMKEELSAYHKVYREINKEKLASIDYSNKRKNPELDLYRRIKARAHKQKLDFDLKLSDIIIPEFCPVLHIPLFIGEGIASPNSPSMDRIDPTKGYTKDNVQVISYKANTMKSNANEVDLLLFAYWVLENFYEGLYEKNLH